MTEREKMLNGDLYMANDPELQELHRTCFEYMGQFNQYPFTDFEFKKAIIKKWFKSTGKNVTIIPPLYCDYGCNVSVGDNFFANFDCIFLDVAEIEIGSNVLLGPRVSIYTAGHPIDSEVRNTGLEYGYKVTIGDNVWIGGNVVINPGVHIGSNIVIASGSVVTHDIEDGVVVGGNPARVIRKITEKDKEFWSLQRQKYENSLKN